MMQTIAFTPPKSIIQGDSYEFKHNFDPYLSVGFTLNFIIRGLVDLTLTTTGPTFTLSTTATGSMTPGLYTSSIVATMAGKRITLSSFKLEVKQDSETPKIEDLRSFNEKILQALEDFILDKADNHQLDHLRSVVGDKELQRMPLDHLLRLRDSYRAKVNAEKGLSVKRILFTNSRA